MLQWSRGCPDKAHKGRERAQRFFTETEEPLRNHETDEKYSSSFPPRDASVSFPCFLYIMEHSYTHHSLSCSWCAEDERATGHLDGTPLRSENENKPKLSNQPSPAPKLMPHRSSTHGNWLAWLARQNCGCRARPDDKKIQRHTDRSKWLAGLMQGCGPWARLS